MRKRHSIAGVTPTSQNRFPSPTSCIRSDHSYRASPTSLPAASLHSRLPHVWAQPVTDAGEVAKAMNLLVTRYTEYAAFPTPKPEEVAVYRIAPKVISVLDYSKGFGHSD